MADSKELSWVRSLSEVTGYQTTQKQLLSKAGKPYTTDVIPKVELICMGSPEAVADENGQVTKYSYLLFDSKHNRQWTVKAPQKLEITGVKMVVCYDVRGGALANRTSGWMACGRIELKK